MLSLSKILNASAFADFLSKNQFTPTHAQRRARPTAPKSVGKINSRLTNLVGTPAQTALKSTEISVITADFQYIFILVFKRNFLQFNHSEYLRDSKEQSSFNGKFYEAYQIHCLVE